MSNRLIRRPTALGLVVMLVLGACSGSSSPSPSASTGESAVPSAADSAAPSGSSAQIGGEVSMLGPWGGDEEVPLRAVLKPFEERTGITVNYTGSRDLVNLLSIGVQSGTAPDVADLPSPGVLSQFAKAGNLTALDDVIDAATYREQVAAGPISIGELDGKIYGIFFLGSIKGLIWYDPSVYTGGTPTSWDDLQAKATAAAAAIPGGQTKPWCVGLGSDAATGWPATDWIEDFVLRQSGADVYDGWVAGTHKWSSPEIRRAFESYGSVVSPDAVFGGPTAAITTNFAEGGNPLFTDPPGCIFHHQASFASQLFQGAGAKPGDYDFFSFPDIDPANSGSVVGAGDYMAMFNDTPQARALISYLATAEAQSIWTGMGGQLSGNRTVTNYPDELQKRSGEVLASAKTFRFDGSDLMPQAMLAAFWVGVLDYTKDPSTLDAVLAKLDEAQSTAYSN
jgi:alpha-glucoside transport system substrate-binding protein